MTHTPVTAHIHQALDVHGHFATEVALDRNRSHLGAQAVCVLLGKIVNLGVSSDAHFITDPLRGDTANAVHRSQRDLYVLVRR